MFGKKKDTAEKTPAKAIKLGSRADEVVKCADCSMELTVEKRHAFKGKNGKDIYYCDSCLEKVNAAFDEETKNINFPMAALFGIGAGVLGGFGWYLITITTQIEFGYAAIGVGYLIGLAIVKGAGKKRGAKLQAMAALLTVISLFLSEMFIFAYFALKEFQKLGFEGTILDLFTRMFLTSGELRVFFAETFFKTMFAPMSLFIWGIGVYVAFMVPKVRRLR